MTVQPVDVLPGGVTAPLLWGTDPETEHTITPCPFSRADYDDIVAACPDSWFDTGSRPWSAPNLLRILGNLEDGDDCEIRYTTWFYGPDFPAGEAMLSLWDVCGAAINPGSNLYGPPGPWVG